MVVLAEGLSEFLATTRRPGGPAMSLETARLIADREAHRIAYLRPAGMTVTDTYVVEDAIETPVRVYRPAGEGAQAAIVYLHGGGFTTGSIESYDAFATALAEACEATVISVHYRRLPEGSPRAMRDQAYQVLCWTERMAAALRIDAARIAVAGDSAGAFLATHLAVLARDRGGPALTCQMLCYGVYDLDPAREAYATARDPMLPRAVIDMMIATYQGCDARDRLPAPLALGDVAGLPPAILLGAEQDAFLAERRAYAERLRAAGVAVEEQVVPATGHGFLRAVRFSAAARDAMQWLGAAFRNRQARTIL